MGYKGIHNKSEILKSQGKLNGALKHFSFFHLTTYAYGKQSSGNHNLFFLFHFHTFSHLLY